MIEILFGWLSKPKILLTPADGIVAMVEVFIVVVIIGIINILLNKK